MSLNLAVYLVDQGAITATQLVDAIRDQLDRKPPIGRLALRQKRLSIKQLFEVMTEQSQSALPFGEIAVQRDFIARPALAELLFLQTQMAPDLGSILVDQGVLTASELANHQRNYQAQFQKADQEPESNRAESSFSL